MNKLETNGCSLEKWNGKWLVGDLPSAVEHPLPVAEAFTRYGVLRTQASSSPVGSLVGRKR